MRWKVAGAPISWGISEVPGWGYRMPPDRVLSEMRSIGLEATELGPPGYLSAKPRELLDRCGLRLAGGFVAVTLHEGPAAALAEVERQATLLGEAGADVLVLAAALPGDGYNRREHLSPEAWKALSETLATAENIVAAHGLDLVLHPHVGTAVESEEEVSRLLSTTGVNLCLDTGHLFLGGSDPIALAAEASARIHHVHLKDVDLNLASAVRSGDLSYEDAVRGGLYRPLGQGGLDIRGVVDRLQQAGYGGWFVLEQDTALTAEPEPASGPVVAARQSLEYFRQITGARQHITASKED